MKELIALALVAACSGAPKRTAVILTGTPSKYPGVLPDPKTLTHDFMVRQTLTITTRRGGKPVAVPY